MGYKTNPQLAERQAADFSFAPNLPRTSRFLQQENPGHRQGFQEPKTKIYETFCSHYSWLLGPKQEPLQN